MAFNLFKKKSAGPKPPKTAVKETSEEVIADQGQGVVAPASTNVLRSFFVSEKSARGQAYGHYTFVVAPNATKTDVKHAVQRAYKVNVTGVHMVRLPAKHRAIGRYQGTTPGIKKAIVVLKEGQTIAQAQP
jgi:large subunit ribosomal protein L23